MMNLKRCSTLIIFAFVLAFFLGRDTNQIVAWCPDADMWDKWEAFGGSRNDFGGPRPQPTPTPTPQPTPQIPTFTRPKAGTGIEPLIFAFPRGLYNSSSMEIVKKSGYKIALLCGNCF